MMLSTASIKCEFFLLMWKMLNRA